VTENPIEIETAPDPSACVIWLHGLGADGSDFVPVIPSLGLPSDIAVRFVFPHAPKIPVTWNGGYVMPAWYDIISVEDENRHADEAGVLKSRESIRQLIKQQNDRGIASERIVIAGFSQGGAIAYTVGLTHPERLAGIIALSTYLPAPAVIERDWTTYRDIPVFAGHGEQDNVVPYVLGERARDVAVKHGFPVEWHAYQMAHSVNLDELADIGRWLAQRLA